MKRPCVYILASAPDGILYIGVTSDIARRMAEHEQGLVEGFTKKYGVKQLVYYEFFETMPDAIQREKRLKKWNRGWKVRLILSMNAQWQNLFDPATGEIKFGPADSDRAGH
jgi:putative endonuclease